MRLSHIIWDWNGTLLDDTQAGLNAVNAMLDARGLPMIDLDAYRERFGFPVQDFYRAIGFRLENEDWDAMACEFHDRFLSDTTLRLHEHALSVLTLFRQTGVPQSVLSASEQSILDDMMRDFGVSHFFDAMFGTDNLYGHSKLDLGHALLQRLTLQPENVLLVGDSLHDHEVATALGTRCLLIAQGHQSHSRLARSGSPVLEDLAQIPAWLNL